MRRAPSSHLRGVNLLKMVPPTRGHGPPHCYEPLHSGPVVESAGMTSSVPLPRAGIPTFQTLWCQLHSGHLASKGLKASPGGWMRGGRGWGRGVRLRKWRGDKFFEEDEGTIRWMEGGEGVDRGGDKLDFWSRLTTHNSLQNLVACLHRTNDKTRLLAWPYVTSRPHLPRNYDRLLQTKQEG